ncbi:MAG: amidohydrolase family protein, partial [Acidobacteriota bacterium]
MLSRRDMIAGVGVAGVVALARRITPVVASAAPATTPVNFSVPRGACDCHTHIVGDPRQFPLTGARAFTPDPASVAELGALHRALHVDRVVIVQPSFYGTDNSCTLDAIAQFGPTARGIAAIDDSTTNAEIDRLHRGGMRGIRVNMIAKGVDAAALRQQFSAAVGRVRGRGWHVELMTTALWQIDALKY